jgi:hypothetical protein
MQVVGKLWRKSPRDTKHMTLDGREVLTTFNCKVCGHIGYYSEAYMEGEGKRKNANHIREFHADCYIKTNGKSKKPKEPSTGSLFDFLR